MFSTTSLSTAAAMDFTVATQINPFKCHSVKARRLWEVTLTGLELNGICTDGLGEKEGGKFILRGGHHLSSYSTAMLPPHLGGFLNEAPIDMSDRTASSINAINMASPSGYKRRVVFSGNCRAGVAPHV